MNIHFPGVQGLEVPGVWAFPKLMVCFNCGSTRSLSRKKSCICFKNRQRWLELREAHRRYPSPMGFSH